MTNPHIVTTVKCSVCGKVKQESNHWFLVWVEPVAMGKGDIFMVAPFSWQFGDEVRPVCGQACAQTELDTWMTRLRNAEAQKANQATAGTTAAKEAVAVSS